MKITLYTDAGCPFGFNAQRQELQLAWHYPSAEVERRMIVLSEETKSIDELPFSADQIQASRQRLADLYGMPTGLEPTDVFAATIDSCRAYIGARMYAPEQSLALLRALRRRAQSDQQRLDLPETIRGAASDAGLDPDTVISWLTNDEVEAALRADMAATRDPIPEALALGYKLSKSDSKLRYSTSSAVFESDGRVVAAAGFQPFAVYEVAVASVDPQLDRRPSPENIDEVLDWAPFALATAEVAELRGISIEAARGELAESGATFTPSATDGYWER